MEESVNKKLDKIMKLLLLQDEGFRSLNDKIERLYQLALAVNIGELDDEPEDSSELRQKVKLDALKLLKDCEIKVRDTEDDITEEVGVENEEPDEEIPIIQKGGKQTPSYCG